MVLVSLSFLPESNYDLSWDGDESPMGALLILLTSIAYPQETFDTQFNDKVGGRNCSIESEVEGAGEGSSGRR